MRFMLKCPLLIYGFSVIQYLNIVKVIDNAFYYSGKVKPIAKWDLLHNSISRKAMM